MESRDAQDRKDAQSLSQVACDSALLKASDVSFALKLIATKHEDLCAPS
jgi:hypothetical protein